MAYSNGKGQIASQGELRVFAQLVRSEEPITVRELSERVEMGAGAVYPIIGRLVNRGVIECDTAVGPARVSMVPSFEAWAYVLKQLQFVQVFTGPLEMLNPYTGSEPAAP